MWRHQNSHIPLEGRENGRQSGGSSKGETELPCDPATPLLSVPKRTENKYSNNNLDTNIPSSACLLSRFSRVRLCDPMDCSWTGSSVRGIFQARILEWDTVPSSRGSSWSRDRTSFSCTSPALAGEFFTTEPPAKPIHSSSVQFSRSVMSDSL